MAAGPVAFPADVIAYLQRSHIRPDLDDLARKLMPHDARRLDAPCRPAVPAIDVVVRSTDRGRFDPDLDLIGPRDLRLRNLDHLRAGRGLRLHDRFHREGSISFHQEVRRAAGAAIPAGAPAGSAQAWERKR